MPATVVRGADPAAVGEILSGLPDWFGIAEANEHYVEAAGQLPSYLAVDGEDVVGVALVAEHFPQARELHLIAVRRDRHRSGVGRLLVETIEADLRRDGVRLLEVHTVGASHEGAGYARTREFYLALGFVAMNELDRIDWDGPTVILVKSL
ncbi:MAG: GNAT family N-acetyltransferase [Nocardioides sp.]